MVELLEYVIHFPVGIKNVWEIGIYLNRVFIINESIFEILREIFP